MTDTDAILARHVPYTDTDDPPVTICVACSQPWGEAGCDAHQLGVALEDLTKARADYVEDRVNEAVAETHQQASHWFAESQAAEAREAKLRAALTESAWLVHGYIRGGLGLPDHPTEDWTDCPAQLCVRNRAALATGIGSPEEPIAEADDA